MASTAPASESTQAFSDVDSALLEVELEELTASLLSPEPASTSGASDVKFTRVFIRPLENKHYLQTASIPNGEAIPRLEADILAITQTTRSIAYEITYPGIDDEKPISLCFYFDPARDDITLYNQSLQYRCYLQHGKNLSPRAISVLPPQRSRLVDPGVWTLLSSGQTPVFEFQVQPRSFCRDAMEPNAPTSAGERKRALVDSQRAMGASTSKKLRTATVILQAPRGDSGAMSTAAAQQHPLLALQDGQTAYLVGQGAEDTYSLSRQKNLASTASASLYTAEHSGFPGQLVVVKALKTRGSTDAREAARIWLREFSVHSGIGYHPSVVRLHAADARFLTMYVEHIDAPALDSDALAWVHDAGFVHNDIKPSNILYNPTHGAVLIDFGLGGRASDPASSGGSPWYIPPDYLAAEARGAPADLFALGVTMAWVLRKCSLPDRGRTWPIANIHYATGPASSEKRQQARREMESWLTKVSEIRDGLSRQGIELVVFNLLVAGREERWSAAKVAREVALLTSSSPSSG